MCTRTRLTGCYTGGSVCTRRRLTGCYTGGVSVYEEATHWLLYGRGQCVRGRDSLVAIREGSVCTRTRLTGCYTGGSVCTRTRLTGCYTRGVSVYEDATHWLLYERGQCIRGRDSLVAIREGQCVRGRDSLVAIREGSVYTRT